MTASDTPLVPATADQTPWALPPQSVLDEVGSSDAGLTAEQARTRLAEVGPNRLAPAARTPWWRRVLSQFDDVLIYILLVSAVLKAIVGDWIDFTVILAVAVINAAIGLIQEGRAEKALDGIRGMLSVHAQVRRDGAWAQVDADDLVPGDVVRVRSGDRVPADLRLLTGVNLRVDESALTGESVPASKSVDAVPAEAGVGDRSSMLFSGTLVSAGTGTGVVVETGETTEIGRIQTLISEVHSLETPLSRTLDAFGKKLAVIILVMAVVMVVIGRVFHGFETPELVSAAIGFAVAAVPEGLPALVTITLALGVQQMARRRAITRRLPAVETLGSVTTICSDKTGTLTKNEMTARTVRTAGHEFAVTGIGYAPDGEVSLDGSPAPLPEHPDLRRLTEVMMLCNDARIVHDPAGEGDGWRLVGEPTEGALRTLGLKAGLDPAGWRRVALVPFESENKYMATLTEDPEGGLHVLVKGAPDRVLDRCSTQTGPDGAPEPLDRDFWSAQVDEIGAQGLRVLAAARTSAAPGSTDLAPEDVDAGLEMVGLVGIVDPPRPEAVEAIAQCQDAGITVKMITGDHSGTALAIAREMGIVRDGDAPAATKVLTGSELEAMSTEELRAVVEDVDVYARTSPEHKIRIVSALQSHGQVVAMTGDGVNDAPALTQADVGVAMGIKGTEATKEAAEVVLADDNFATIERAVEEGRRIYDNLRKSVLFLLPTNGAQSLVILVAVLLGWALPLQPVQVLWINMVTAVTLSLALANERAEPDVMSRAPRDAKASILTAAYLRRILLVSVLIGGATMAVYFIERDQGMGVAEAQTTAVTMLALGQLAYLFNCRFLDRSSITPAVLQGNRAIWYSAGSLLALQAVFVYAPFMHSWFGSAPIGLREWGITLGLAIVVFLLVEAAKALGRTRQR
ncbi:HAD family hydrolase [Oerskovia turbata]|uniref:HAD family hydrolase n=1 Tax=Oerskovia turbata TaxID=1713 RepID=A0A4Q1L114_9CELL|nr:HAD-IC family P-type ATPase [Oerskovia turbata]RXR27009.1 HAD family hydrolase [Oerskovia turbata]RXR36423.1 HAD family hydrolase [Oerskovia turbata]TGJ95417.1 carbonate dehydratase [Actinotalea fermentans ATCC 43279 = JCM 9966 = DSM 3133]